MVEAMAAITGIKLFLIVVLLVDVWVVLTGVARYTIRKPASGSIREGDGVVEGGPGEPLILHHSSTGQEALRNLPSLMVFAVSIILIVYLDLALVVIEGGDLYLSLFIDATIALLVVVYLTIPRQYAITPDGFVFDGYHRPASQYSVERVESRPLMGLIPVYIVRRTGPFTSRHTLMMKEGEFLDRLKTLHETTMDSKIERVGEMVTAVGDGPSEETEEKESQ